VFQFPRPLKGEQVKFTGTRRGRVVLAISAILALLGLSACTYTATSSAMCSFIVGNGSSGNDKNLHDIVYPGENVQYDDQNEQVWYVPCNSRNYITNDGEVQNANDERVGDRFDPTIVYTSSGVPIKVWSTVSWTPNQNEEAMRNFYALCFKYSCASDSDQGGDSNFSTKGWNGMLAENFGPAIDRTMAAVATGIGDEIWQKHDAALYAQLGDETSAQLADAVRRVVGYDTDLFCGAGNSAWPDPTKPGEGEFECTAMRVVIDRVERGDVSEDASGTGAVAINQQRVENARVLYGDLTEEVLAALDILDVCARLEQAVCNVTLPGSVPGSVAVPAPTP
jgi:hypothetical protein